MLLDLLETRRSIRKFQSKDVEKEKIDLLLRGALLSPSSRAIRPWEFVAVDDKVLLQKLARCKRHGSDFLAEAPLGIVVLADPAACDVWIEDASIASFVIHLVAHSLGLGSCWIQIRERDHSESEKAGNYIKSILHIPAEYEIESIIAIGYPQEKKAPGGINELKHQKLHFNMF